MPVPDDLRPSTRWRLPRPAVIVALIVASELSVTGVGIAAVSARPRGWSATATTGSITAQAAPRTTSALRTARGNAARHAVPGAPVPPGVLPPAAVPAATSWPDVTQSGVSQPSTVDITDTTGWPDPTLAPDPVDGGGTIVNPTPSASPGAVVPQAIPPTPAASDPVPDPTPPPVG